MIILVIVQHLAVTYSGFGSWYFMEGRPIGTVSTILFGFYQSFTQGYFMGLLFLIAGFFVPAAFDRKGFGKYLKDRFLRLMVPAMVYVLIFQPLILYFQLDLNWLSVKPGFFEFYAGFVTSTSVLNGTGPLWFAVALFFFSTVYGLFRLVCKTPSTLPRSIKPRLIGLVGLILLIGLFAFLVRIVQPVGTSFFNMQLGYFPQYIVLFAVGILSFRGDLFSKISLRAGKRWLLAALVPGAIVWVCIMLLSGALNGSTSFNGGLCWQSAAYSLWESFTAVAVSAGLIALFREKFSAQSKLVKAMSDSTFAVYVFHTPIIIAAAQWFAPVVWPPIIKFSLLVLVCVLVCFAAAHFIIRRVPVLRRIM